MSGDSYSFGYVGGSVQTGGGVQNVVGRDQYGVATAPPGEQPPAASGETPPAEGDPSAIPPAVLRVRVERDGDGYVAVADSSHGGTYRTPMTMTIGSDDVSRFEATLRSGASRDVGDGGDGGNVAGSSAAAVSAVELGTALFGALFAGEVRTGLRHTQTRADIDGVPMRLELRLDAVPELAAVPWELLRDGELGRTYALSNRTPVIRHLGVAEPVRRVAKRGPLRVLVVAASPPDLAPLAVEREWAGMRAELAPAIDGGQVELHRVAPPTVDGVGRAMLHGPWHVFHFIGHGGWTDDGGAALAFAGDDGRSRAVTAGSLAMTLGDDVNLRVAVLNACHTARGTDRRVLDGVAQGLLRQGIPAVVAMQFAISDAGAIRFAERLYASLAAGLSIDRAVVEGRKALADRGAEWVTPAVYLRGDGVVFDGDT